MNKKMQKIRRIVETKSYATVDGATLDLFTASHILTIYENLSPENQARYEALPVLQMASIAFKLLNK